MPENKVTLPHYHCGRCGHDWIPRKDEEPERCPKCGSPYWNKPYKGIKYAEQ